MKNPNILHIFVDQQRFDTIEALGNGVIKTPNINRLVKSGVSFTNAYTPSPVCIAARCSMIYGQYPANTGCYENNLMPEDSRDSFMGILSNNGYTTHGIGKCHFSPDLYAMRGFQTREIQEEGPADSLEKNDYYRYLFEEGYTHLLEPHGVRGEMYYIPQPSQVAPKDHPTQWIGDRSVKFIKEKKGSSDPWYLFSSFIHPHPPFAPPNPWHKLYRADNMPLPNIPDDYEALHTLVNKCQNRYKYRDNGFDLNLIRIMKAYYYACISFVDYQIGRLLDELESTGAIDNTMIIFTADHGEHLGDYKCVGKRSMHDSSARIPLIISMPNKFDGNRVCDQAVSLVDIAPTIIGATNNATPTHKMDGIDLNKLLTNEVKREFVFSQLSFPQASNFLDNNKELMELDSNSSIKKTVFSSYMAASKSWKYFYSAPDNKSYLFDKNKDPYERVNLADNPLYKNDFNNCKKTLINHLKEVNETDGIKDNDFIPYSLPKFKSDPDSNHLIQDGYTPWGCADIKGYTDT